MQSAISPRPPATPQRHLPLFSPATQGHHDAFKTSQGGYYSFGGGGKDHLGPSAEDEAEFDDNQTGMDVDEDDNATSVGDSGYLRSPMEQPYAPSGKGHQNFPAKLYGMLNEPKLAPYLQWAASGQGFIVTNVDAFTRDVLTKHFKHGKFQSFVRQLNMYDFHKVTRAPRRKGGGPSMAEFNHAQYLFRRDRVDLLPQIRRKAHEQGGGLMGGHLGDAVAPGSETDTKISMGTFHPAHVDELRILREQYNTLVQSHNSLLASHQRLETLVASHASMLSRIISSGSWLKEDHSTTVVAPSWKNTPKAYTDGMTSYTLAAMSPSSLSVRLGPAANPAPQSFTIPDHTPSFMTHHTNQGISDALPPANQPSSQFQPGAATSPPAPAPSLPGSLNLQYTIRDHNPSAHTTNAFAQMGPPPSYPYRQTQTLDVTEQARLHPPTISPNANPARGPSPNAPNPPLNISNTGGSFFHITTHMRGDPSVSSNSAYLSPNSARTPNQPTHPSVDDLLSAGPGSRGLAVTTVPPPSSPKTTSSGAGSVLGGGVLGWPWR